MKLNLLSILVSNHFGVLMRVTTIFSRRTCNIKSLTVAETQDPKLSRITISYEADEEMAVQIFRLLEKQEDVISVVNLSPEQSAVRELMLIKVKDSGALQNDLEVLKEQYHIDIISAEDGVCVVEFVDNPKRCNDFFTHMEQYGIIEISRTGATALAYGTANIYDVR